jgi:alkane 1-monooxygenase
MKTLSPVQVAKIHNAAPFYLSLLLVPLAIYVATQGGWSLVLIPLASWGLFSVLDRFTGLNTENADLACTEDDLFWYTLVTKIWFPIQAALVFGLIYYATRADHLGTGEKIGLFFGVGVITGTVGVVYAHELMHQKNRSERWLGDLLLANVLYGHFRSEHLLVHHRYVATPRDPVTARYNEGFYRFFPRVLKQSLISSFKAEKAMLARKNLPWTDLSNPFFRYWALQLGMLVLGFILGGWIGVGLFAFQAFVAIWELELVNFIEHYGLTRKHLGDGKYEHVQPRHSWNASQRASNWMLINLQRHSDHHYKPDRRFPLLQNYTPDQAPQLPYGYPVITMAAMVPPIFRKIMNPRVRKWRAMYYPEIIDWTAYKCASNPWPR